jgi:hypothetical protein
MPLFTALTCGVLARASRAFLLLRTIRWTGFELLASKKSTAARLAALQYAGQTSIEACAARHAAWHAVAC